MSSVLELFKEYYPLNDKDAQITLRGDFSDWTWFKIYVFTKNKEDWFAKRAPVFEQSFVKG